MGLAEIKLQKLSTLARSVKIIFDSQSTVLPRVCVFSNISEYNAGFALHVERDIYRSRAAVFDRIELVDLPPGAIVHSNLSYVTTVGDYFVEEQFIDGWRKQDTPHRHALQSDAPVIKVDEPCLLVARYGAMTWGHWLGELLPRAVAAEAAAPGKYRFVVPAETTNAGWNAPIAQNVLGSLRAYGIGEDRLLRVGQKHRYEFENLAAVTSMWTYPYAIHPEALELMRSSIKIAVPGAPAGAKAAAMLRAGEDKRSIENADDVLDVLRAKGFTGFDIGRLPFIEQVSIFQEANSLFGVLGSNLTGLLYSPKGVKTVSAAPGDWGNCFFHGLLQNQHGLYADLRGTPNQGFKEKIWAPFTLSIERLLEALEAVNSS